MAETSREGVAGPEVAPAGHPPFSWAVAMAAILIPMPLAAASAWLGTHVLGDYGWGLFVGLPFALPMLSVAIYGLGLPITLKQSFGLGWLWILAATLAVVATAFEGLI